jgi:opacity protein-like surface antigen
MRVLLLVLTCGVTPAWASAQTLSATLPANDTIIAVGWAGSAHEVHQQRPWHGSLLVAHRVGRYWTDHLKTEIEGSWTSPHSSDVYEPIERQAGYTYALSEYRAHDVGVGVSQIYQFGRNEWVHPYLGAGVDITRRKTSLSRAAQTRAIAVQNRTWPVDIPAARERATKTFASAVLRTGVKMYVSERAFIDTEFKLGLRHDVDRVIWRLGVGLDF